MCLAPHTPFCHTPFHPSLASAPYSRPPHIPYRPSLASAPASRPPQAPFRPRLASAPASRPPQAPFRPSLPCVHACVCWVSANFHRQKPSVAARCVSAGLHRCEVHAQLCVGSQTHRLPSCREARQSLRWSTPAPTANDLRQELELTRFQVDRGSYATSSAPPTPTRPYSLHTPPPPTHAHGKFIVTVLV